ncbi:MAG: class I SAM-dependent methyltransferase [Betaproteobacteria bacterium]|nr:MAG: class I SAM-dependent methyltransferase [Betaproteobacteria bacterium]
MVALSGRMRELVIGGETLQNANGLQEVRAFWSTEACGTHFIQRFTDEHDFFSKYREFRYRTEWHIPAFASFAQAKGKRVLEIGCGNGADGVMFTSHGAHYTGVDLTPQAVDATRRHFAAEGLDGQFRLEDAERLSFADDSFDIVYSYGVLHHTPAPQRAVHEVYRVLKPGGVALVMLYHRHSFNYYVRILGYMRARVLLKIVSRLGRSKADRNRSAAGQLVGVRGNASEKLWEIHYDNFLKEGWSYLRARNFVHHCTDGPECPCAYTYSRRDAPALFAPFRTVEMKVAHFPLNKYPGGQWIPRAAERFVAGRMGWHLLIRATK